jgi:hypothetical protein
MTRQSSKGGLLSKNKKQVGKQRKSKYTGLDEYLNPETAMVQAALLLDEAAFNAIESKDDKAMTRVSRGWMELGAVLHNISVAQAENEEEGEESEEEDVLSQTKIMGFASPEDREVAESAYKN